MFDRGYYGNEFPSWLRPKGFWTLRDQDRDYPERAKVRRIWDSDADVVMYVEVETGEVIVWCYRTRQLGGSAPFRFSTWPYHLDCSCNV